MNLSRGTSIHREAISGPIILVAADLPSRHQFVPLKDIEPSSDWHFSSRPGSAAPDASGSPLAATRGADLAQLARARRGLRS
jgi:hypothetical protein